MRKHTVGMQHTTLVFLICRLWAPASTIARLSHPGLFKYLGRQSPFLKKISYCPSIGVNRGMFGP